MTPTPGLVERLRALGEREAENGRPHAAGIITEAAEALSQAEADLAGARGECKRLREGLEEVVCWHGEAPHTFPDWKTTAGALAEMAQNVLDGYPALSSPESRAALPPSGWVEVEGTGLCYYGGAPSSNTEG